MKKYDLTQSLGFQAENENYFTPAGNGKHIIQHKLDDRETIKTKKKDKDGKIVKDQFGNEIEEEIENPTFGKMVVKYEADGKTPKTTDLFQQIQNCKDSTDYKKLIEENNFDLDKVNLALISKNPTQTFNYYKDFTNFGSIEELKSMENKIVNTFGSIEKFKEYTQKKIVDYTAQLQKQKKYWEKAKKELEIKKVLAKTKKAEESGK